MMARLPSAEVIATEYHRPLVLGSGVMLAVVAAGAAVISPLFALAGIGGMVAIGLLSYGEKLRTLFLVSLGALLVGYLFFGRGLAHVGVAPLYVGEMVFGLGCLYLLLEWQKLKLGLLELLVIAFIALGAARTLPYIREYGIDALRDAVLWAYALIAFAVMVALPSEDKGASAVRLYHKILPFLLVWIPIAGILSVIAPDVIPPAPGSDISLLGFKGGDMGVHLAGAAAFIAIGLYSPGFSGERMQVSQTWLWVAWFAGLAVVGISRGGLLSAGIGLFAAFLLKPSWRAVQLAGVVGIVIFFAALLEVEIDLGKSNERVISAEQFWLNIQSVFGAGPDSGLQGTRDFRLDWWGTIIDYTFNGPYFLDGKGFGVNLADSDGFQLFEDGDLRAPHNSHFTVLARMGVPGFLLWILLNLAFAGSLAVAWRRCSKAGLNRWAAIDGWVLVYWAAFMMNTSFDPYLEGPQGGIPFWALIGFGLYALRTQYDELRRLDRREITEKRRRLHAKRQVRPPALPREA